MRLIGVACFLLALYIVDQFAFTLVTGIRPATSAVGIGWLAATVLALVILAHGKRLTGRTLDNAVLGTEGQVTPIDALLATVVLMGLVLNAVLG